MTEAEAKTKWCPFVRVAHAPDAVNGCNRPFDYAAQTCIASACMAWRKTVADFDRRTGEVALPGTPEASREPRYSGHGYCGLAGAPA